MQLFKKKHKKAQMNWLMGFVIGFIVLVVLLAVGASLVQNIRDNQTANSLAYNISDSGLKAYKTFGDYQSTIAVIGVVVFLIGLLVGYLYVRMKGAGQ